MRPIEKGRADANLSMSVIALKVNGLNTPIKRLRLLDTKQDPTMCYQQEMHFRFKVTNK